MPSTLYKVRNPNTFSRFKYANICDDYSTRDVVDFWSSATPRQRAKLFKIAEKMRTDDLNAAYREYTARSGDDEDGLEEDSEEE